MADAGHGFAVEPKWLPTSTSSLPLTIWRASPCLGSGGQCSVGWWKRPSVDPTLAAESVASGSLTPAS